MHKTEKAKGKIKMHIKRTFKLVLVMIVILLMSFHPWTLYWGGFEKRNNKDFGNKNSSIRMHQRQPYTLNSKKPHILFILADDLGFHDVGYHGSDIKTPNLDELAMSGVRLENYYTQSICTPTRACLLTGRYAIHTGVQRAFLPGQTLGMPLDDVTLAEKLRETDYSTHIIGKWHLGFFKKAYLPNNRGFDNFFGFYNGHSDYFTHITKHRQGVKGYDLMDNDQPANFSAYDGYYSTDLFADKTIDIIQKHDSNKPLFMYLSLQAVHSPVQSPEKCMALKEKKDRKVRNIYEGMVVCMDDAVGRVVEAVKEKGMWENTILVFSTDNGGPEKTGASNYPLKGFKGSGWEGGNRAVGFINSPLLSKEVTGTVSKGLMHVTDWFPTFVKLAGGNLNGTKPLDGIDQWNHLKYGAPSQRQEILHDIVPSDSPGEPLENVSLSTSLLRRVLLRVGKWKLMKEFSPEKSALEQFRVKSKTYLFDIEKDPSESNDVASKYPDIVKRMLDRVKSYLHHTVPSPNPKEDPRADPRFRKGYWEPWMD